jgi:hypothetical protein
VVENLYRFRGDTSVGIFEPCGPSTRNSPRFAVGTRRQPRGDGLQRRSFLHMRRRREQRQDRRCHFGGWPGEPPRLGVVHTRIESPQRPLPIPESGPSACLDCPHRGDWKEKTNPKSSPHNQAPTAPTFGAAGNSQTQNGPVSPFSGSYTRKIPLGRWVGGPGVQNRGSQGGPASSSALSAHQLLSQGQNITIATAAMAAASS